MLVKRVKKKKRIIFFSSLVFQSKGEKKERGKAGEMILIINERRHEVNDDSFFKSVFDKNKKRSEVRTIRK